MERLRTLLFHGWKWNEDVNSWQRFRNGSNTRDFKTAEELLGEDWVNTMEFVRWFMQAGIRYDWNGWKYKSEILTNEQVLEMFNTPRRAMVKVLDIIEEDHLGGQTVHLQFTDIKLFNRNNQLEVGQSYEVFLDRNNEILKCKNLNK
jgi:Fe-S cluster biosynthesis and repair protein YggX